MKQILLTNVLLLLSFAGIAQNVTVKGKVTDSFGNGISDVSVIIKGTTKGVATNGDGNYSLNVKTGKSTLVFSAIGLKTIKKTVNTETDIQLNVILEEDVTLLDEATIKMERRLKVNKLNIKNLEVPMTINTISPKLLQQWDITNMEDASKNITGINSVNRYGGFLRFNIRGFDNFVLLYDGIRDERHNITSSAPVANFANVERVEVLKGPSSTLFGHSALGGIINIIRKKPTYNLQGNAKITVGSYNTYNMIVGVGGPISDKVRYRIDAGFNRTEGWKNVKENTNNMSLMLEYTPNDASKLEFFTQYNKDHYGANVGVPATSNGKPLAGINPRTNFANPNDYLKNEKKEFQLKYTHKFNENTVLTNQFSYYDDSIDYLEDEVLFYNVKTKKFSRRNGPYHFNHVTKPLNNRLDVVFKFNTGNIEHKSIVGSSLSYLDRKTFYGNVTTGTDEKGLDVDNFANVGERKVELTSVKSIKEYVSSIYFQDWITFSESFKVLLGGRYDYFSGDREKNPRLIKDKPVFFKESFGNFTYRGAFSLEAVEDFLTVYGSASSFFKPARRHHAKTNAIFKPESGHQIEGGIKLEKENRLNVTLSGFYIKKKNLIVGHVTLTQVGKATSKGLELDADAEPVDGLYLKLGYAYTDASFDPYKADGKKGKLSNNIIPWTPKHQVNTWVNYEVRSSDLEGLGLGLGAKYVSKTFQNPSNTQTLPAYTVLNGTIYYQAKSNIRIGLNIENLADKLYYNNSLSTDDLYTNKIIDPVTKKKVDPIWKKDQSTHQIYPARGRNYKLSLSYNF